MLTAPLPRSDLPIRRKPALNLGRHGGDEQIIGSKQQVPHREQGRLRSDRQRDEILGASASLARPVVERAKLQDSAHAL